MHKQKAKLKARENTCKENQSRYSVIYVSNWDLVFCKIVFEKSIYFLADLIVLN